MASSWYVKVGMPPHPSVDLFRQTSGHIVRTINKTTTKVLDVKSEEMRPCGRLIDKG
jgi:hypothetical protein